MSMLLSYPSLRSLLILCSSAFFLTACSSSTEIDHRASPEAATKRMAKTAQHHSNAMISVANPLAAKTGYDILRAGGNALDAAIAAQMVLNLVEPQSSGIGGGGFLLIYDPATKSVISYDGRETAPHLADEYLFINKDGKKMKFFEAAVGGRAVGTPGLVQMLDTAHQQFGQMNWPDLFDDAISLSRNGFAVSERLHMLTAKDKFLKADPVARRYFYQPNDQPHPVGTLLKNPALAHSLSLIQKYRSKGFYEGPLAQDMVTKVKNHPTNPGQLSLNDLRQYKAKQRAALCNSYRIYNVCGMAPPSSGGLTVLEILGLIEHYDLNNDPKPEIDRDHLLLEASKLAFADRNHFIADPDFVKVPVKQLLSKSYLSERQTLIRHNSSLATPVTPGGPFLFSHYAPHDQDHGISTTHMSIIDENGMVVSITTSIENAFGSRQMIGGFLLNNQLTDFSFAPAKNGQLIANRVEAGKRPRSSMAPTIVLDQKNKRPVLAIGSPGGSRIIGYVTQSLIHILDQNMALDKAIAKGHLTNRNGSSDLEQGTDAENLEEKLEQLGHTVTLKPMVSGLHAIQVHKDGSLTGAADPRREGIVLGY
ncbi:MAG: gamma-glutamyltransferase [Methylocystaceae bacterium]|nr:gamma-glutamyltransferase [Methylocystaceae bacterium]